MYCSASKQSIFEPNVNKFGPLCNSVDSEYRQTDELLNGRVKLVTLLTLGQLNVASLMPLVRVLKPARNLICHPVFSKYS